MYYMLYLAKIEIQKSKSIEKPILDGVHYICEGFNEIFQRSK